MRRSESDLKFKTSSSPQPSLEIDLGSIPASAAFPFVLEGAVLSHLKANPTSVATVYVHFAYSFTFHEPTSSAFVAVVGGRVLLDVIEQAFSRTAGVNLRASDHIPARERERALHIEDGAVWYPDEPGMWASIPDSLNQNEPAGEDSDDDPAEEDTEVDADGVEEDDNDIASNTASPAGLSERTAAPKSLRTRAARSDASIGSIKHQIEIVFGLPSGSVSLRGPDRKPLRADATIGTLRDRWE